MAVGLRTRERQHPGTVAYGDLALLPPALVRCAAAASAGGVYKMTPSVGAAGCYANGKRPARHCLAPGLLIWLYAYDRANQVPPALYSSNWQVPWHIFLTKPFAQHRPHGVSGPITVGPPSTAGGHRPLCAARGQSRRQGHVRGLRARQRVFLARRLLSELKVAPSRRAQCCRDSSFSTNVDRSGPP